MRGRHRRPGRNRKVLGVKGIGAGTGCALPGHRRHVPDCHAGGAARRSRSQRCRRPSRRSRATVQFSVGFDPDGDRYFLDGEDVSVEIRGDEVTGAVSAVSSVRRGAYPAWCDCSASWPKAGAVSWSRAATSGPWCCPTRREDFPDRLGRRPGPGVATTRTSRRLWPMTTKAVLADVRRRDHLDSTRAVSPLRAAATRWSSTRAR